MSGDADIRLDACDEVVALTLDPVEARLEPAGGVVVSLKTRVTADCQSAPISSFPSVSSSFSSSALPPPSLASFLPPSTSSSSTHLDQSMDIF